MSENSEGVVINQADNRYNLILLGMYLSTQCKCSSYLAGHQKTLPVKLTFAFWGRAWGPLLCLYNIIHSSKQQEIDFYSSKTIKTILIYLTFHRSASWKAFFSDKQKVLWRIWLWGCQWVGIFRQILASFR